VTPYVRQPERLIDKIAVFIAGGLASAAPIIAWLFFVRATSKSWRDGLALGAGALAYTAGLVVLGLLEKRAFLRRHRAWLRPIGSFGIVFAAAMIVAVVYPDHPWKAALYWGFGLGLVQLWSTAHGIRRSSRRVEIQSQQVNAALGKVG